MLSKGCRYKQRKAANSSQHTKLSIKLSCRKFSSTTTPETDLDIVVVGGGMVGAALVNALGISPYTKHFKVGLIETAKVQDKEIKLDEYPDLRVSAINSGSLELLKALGVWDSISTYQRHAPYQSMKVWDSNAPSNLGSISFDSPNKDQPLGTIIENKLIQQSLQRNFFKLENLSIFSEETVKDIQLPAENSNDLVKITTNSGKSLNTRLIVGADGNQSVVRTFANLSAVSYPYHQMGVVCSVLLENPNNSSEQLLKTAYQRFLPSGNGPVALLPMYGPYASVVWSLQTPKARTMISLPDDVFLTQLEAAFLNPISPHVPLVHDVAKMLGVNALEKNYVPMQFPKIKKIVGPKNGFPLKYSHASGYCKSRLALIGDAAHTIHPLAGQGVNLGFGDVVSLTNQIASAVENGEDVGSLNVLKRYENERYVTNQTMMSTCDGIKFLFESNFAPVSFIRSVGLTATNALGPIKDQLMAVAMAQQYNLSKIRATTTTTSTA